MRRSLSFSLGAMLVLGLAVGVGGRARPAHASRTASSRSSAQTYTDASGDTHGAPDILSTVISNDPGSGVVTVTVTLASFQAIGAMAVYMDVDKNAGTGSPGFGSDFLVAADSDSSGITWDAASWTNGDWHPIPNSPTLNFSRSGSVLTWTFSTAESGIKTGFRFHVESRLLDANYNTTDGDSAPDDGLWTYDLAVAPPPPPPATPKTPAAAVTPVVGSATISPAKLVAGKPAVVTFPLTRSDDGSPLTGGKATCGLSVAGASAHCSGSIGDGTVRLTFTVPKSAKGKPVKLTLKVTVGSRSATKSVTLRA